jgi:hypothetical protein
MTRSTSCTGLTLHPCRDETRELTAADHYQISRQTSQANGISQGLDLLHQLPGSLIDLLARTRKEIETKEENESAAPAGGTRLTSKTRKLPKQREARSIH